MKRLLLLIFPAFIWSVSFTSCDANDAELVFLSRQSAEELYKKLESAYKCSSTKDLKKFFKEWNVSVSSNEDDFIKQNNVIEAIYEVYKEFYNPLDLTKLGDWEWGNSLNSNSQYVVVQNRIDFAVVEEEFFDMWFLIQNFDSICDFRPPLNLAKDKILYLTPEYKKSINMFLGTESTQMGENGIMTPSLPQGESEKRYAFLRPNIPILHGHWGNYWHLATHPEISHIVIDKNTVAAKVLFRVGYQGGEAILKKKSKGWTIEESRATWIE